MNTKPTIAIDGAFPNGPADTSNLPSPLLRLRTPTYLRDRGRNERVCHLQNRPQLATEPVSSAGTHLVREVTTSFHLEEYNVMDVLENLSFWKPGGSGARYVLGVMATEDLLYAVLIERGEESTQVVRRFSRQRGSDYTGSDPALPPPIPGQADEHEGEDFTLQFGGEASADKGNLFLGSEFGEIEDQGSFVGEPDRSPAPTFALELSDILEECRDAGFEDLAVVLAQPASDSRFEELTLPDVSGEPSDKQLRKALDVQYDGAVVDERLAFIPMTPTDEDVTRYLAVLGRERDHLIATLEDINEQDVSDLPRRWLVDTELTLYLGLARSILRRELRDQEDHEEHNTLVVRVGDQDTLAMFLRGDRLLHAEMLRSLTSFDPPETVCSRVLLLQDEYEMGDMDRVLLIGEEEEELAGSFEMFFVDAEVDAFRSQVPGGEDRRKRPRASASLLPLLPFVSLIIANFRHFR